MAPVLLAIEDAESYVGGAYLFFLLLILVYVALMAAKLERIQREIGELAELSDRGGASKDLGQVREREQQMDSVRQEARR